MPTHAATRANFGTLNATKDGSQADGSAAARERARWFPPADVEPDPSLMPLRVAYQGEPGAYSEAAVHEAFKNAGRHIDACGYESFEEVFSALVDGAVDHAAVPIENTLGGSIHVNYDLMLRYHGKVHIVGEHSFRVRHMLLALPGVKKADVKKAMSHPQALSQTEGYLRHAGIKQVPAYDTAGSAKLIREQGLRDTAAIASSRAAEVHGLEVLDFGIEDECNNFTRFLFFGRTPCAMPEDTPAKTSVVFVPKKNEAGVLFKALSVFAVREVDLSKIESRPFRPGALPVAQCLVDGAPSAASLARKTSSTELAGAAFATPSFDYAFYIDFLAAATEPRAINAFRHLEEIARLVKVLGTYPIEGLALDTGETAAASEGGPSKVVHTPALAFPLRVAIIGFGTFGQFLAKLWVQRGHQVYAQSRTDYSELAEAMGATYVKTAAELVPFEVDVVVISVSILSFAKVLRSLPRALLSGTLVADMLSVKAHAKQEMLATLPPDADILCLHPMFGPDSGKNGWGGLPCVYDSVRVANFHRCARFLSLFENEGCRMVKMSCEQHDHFAAGSQFVTHLTGRLLARLQPKPSPIATSGYQSLLRLVDNTCSDSFDLFYALYSHNPNAGEQLQQFGEAFDQLRKDLISFEVSGGAPAPSGSTDSFRLSKRVTSMALSRTVAVTDAAAALRREGHAVISLSVGEPDLLPPEQVIIIKSSVIIIKVISLSVGEPDLLPPEQVMAAAHAALRSGKVRYTENAGMHELRAEICTYLRVAKGVSYEPAQVLCSSGAKASLLQAMMALLEPGDEVLIPAPYWVSYPQIAALCGATPVLVQTRAEDGFCLLAADMEAAISPKTRALVLCNPSNPTGAVHPAPLLEKLAAVLRRHPQIVVIADEIYEQITYDEPHVAFASLPGMAERTVTINGFSKGAAMTGFRIGYLAAPKPIAAAANKIQSQNTSCPCSVSQHAALAALREVPPDYRRDAVASFRAKRDYVLSRLRAVPGLSCPTPQGAFYLFPTFSAFYGRITPAGKLINNSEALCLYLLETCHLALVPGSAFGDDECLRISYATSMEELATACDRISEGLAQLAID